MHTVSKTVSPRSSRNLGSPFPKEKVKSSEKSMPDTCQTKIRTKRNNKKKKSQITFTPILI